MLGQFRPASSLFFKRNGGRILADKPGDTPPFKGSCRGVRIRGAGGRTVEHHHLFILRHFYKSYVHHIVFIIISYPRTFQSISPWHSRASCQENPGHIIKSHDMPTPLISFSQTTPSILSPPFTFQKQNKTPPLNIILGIKKWEAGKK